MPDEWIFVLCAKRKRCRLRRDTPVRHIIRSLVRDCDPDVLVVLVRVAALGAVGGEERAVGQEHRRRVLGEAVPLAQVVLGGQRVGGSREEDELLVFPLEDAGGLRARHPRLRGVAVVHPPWGFVGSIFAHLTRDRRCNHNEVYNISEQVSRKRTLGRNARDVQCKITHAR